MHSFSYAFMFYYKLLLMFDAISNLPGVQGRSHGYDNLWLEFKVYQDNHMCPLVIFGEQNENINAKFWIYLLGLALINYCTVAVQHNLWWSETQIFNG